MQSKKNTGMRTAANDYVTIVAQASTKVKGFKQLYKEMDRAINVSGKSKSTLTNYGRQPAHLALHYKCLPTELDNEQVLDYLHLVKSKCSRSATFFKFTVYGMRYACKLRGLSYQQFSLPKIVHDEKLPVVLSQQEMKALLKACTLLKHSILLATTYGCGLRCAEVRQLSIADVDLQRGMLHVKNGKGGKDRYVPLGAMLTRGIAKYLQAERPKMAPASHSAEPRVQLVKQPKRLVSSRQYPHTPYATAMLLTCWNKGLILLPSKNCWATQQ